MFYASGHAVTFDGEYHFIPVDMIFENEQALRVQSLSATNLSRYFASVAAQKVLVLLDTCRSGQVILQGRGTEDNAALARLMRNTGRTILAAASDAAIALELPSGHGAFTLAVLEGLRGLADLNNDGIIDVDELSTYVSHRVPELTRGLGYQQFPMRSTLGLSFPLTRVP